MLISEQKLKKIGERLYRNRIEQNITLENVAAKTLISKRILTAIEQGRVKDLPEPFYTKALIAKYAQAIGVTEILDEEELEEIIEDQQNLVSTSKQANISPSLPAFQLKSRHLYFIYLFLVIAAVKAIASFVEQPVVVDRSTISEPEVAVSTATPTGKSTPTTISSASPSQFVSQSTSNNSESVVVDITLKDRCWLKVMVDGKVEFEGTLPKGTQRSWTAREQINIIAGNAGGVVVTYNHGQEKLLGKPGQVEEVTYTVN
ncbi:conserved hypothetical protein [Hyella patelloides LEGE 07179]|uniref:Cytoskeleton protein RodZ-like C-terminal domain-containing protein n=1 Tax=Hyella patelloides LEGE 07179 TaxID=945734 RepID=A0A563VND4_9CYAN|nr:RodZ domain-containing protein [Hyella patelloides]VEP12954.1 conserved hypothetical protein [Hyella patelloides LEGE 07179]